MLSHTCHAHIWFEEVTFGQFLTAFKFTDISWFSQTSGHSAYTHTSAETTSVVISLWCALKQWRIQYLQTGGQGWAPKARGSRRRVAERRRREYRGAEVWVSGGDIPLPNGEGSGEVALPPIRKIFRFWVWKWRLLVHSGRYSYSSLFILPWTV